MSGGDFQGNGLAQGIAQGLQFAQQRRQSELDQAFRRERLELDRLNSDRSHSLGERGLNLQSELGRGNLDVSRGKMEIDRGRAREDARSNLAKENFRGMEVGEVIRRNRAAEKLQDRNLSEQSRQFDRSDETARRGQDNRYTIAKMGQDREDTRQKEAHRNRLSEISATHELALIREGKIQKMRDKSDAKGEKRRAKAARDQQGRDFVFRLLGDRFQAKFNTDAQVALTEKLNQLQVPEKRDAMFLNMFDRFAELDPNRASTPSGQREIAEKARAFVNGLSSLSDAAMDRAIAGDGDAALSLLGETGRLQAKVEALLKADALTMEGVEGLLRQTSEKTGVNISSSVTSAAEKPSRRFTRAMDDAFGKGRGTGVGLDPTKIPDPDTVAGAIGVDPVVMRDIRATTSSDDGPLGVSDAKALNRREDVKGKFVGVLGQPVRVPEISDLVRALQRQNRGEHRFGDAEDVMYSLIESIQLEDIDFTKEFQNGIEEGRFTSETDFSVDVDAFASLISDRVKKRLPSNLDLSVRQSAFGKKRRRPGLRKVLEQD